MAVDVAIAAIAAKQNGNITRRQLLALGLDDSAIAWRVKMGRLYRVFRGVYSVGRPPVTPHEWASAAVLACGAGRGPQPRLGDGALGLLAPLGSAASR